MAKRQNINVPGENRLLAMLPRAELKRLHARLEPVSLGLRTTLYEPEKPISHVFFPLSGVMSLVIETKNGAVEVGTVGNEGMVGVPLFLGSKRTTVRAFAQVPGEALRMRAEYFQDELNNGSPLHGAVNRFTVALMSQVFQSVACNHLHSIEERMCRWLLITHDRVGEDELPLTQEFLAQMLGVRRPSVTVVAGLLQKAGLIAYHRGKIKVLDRARLEASSCECYEVVKKEYERLLG